MDIGRRLSSLARGALARESNDYLSKDVDEIAVVEQLKREHCLERVYRFDVGKNTDGYSPLIDDVFQMPELVGLITGSLLEYPENSYRLLRNQLALRHSLPPEWFTLGAGLESVIDQISRAVLDPGDTALFPAPNFDVFESSTIKTGAHVEHVMLQEPRFRWDETTVQELTRRMEKSASGRPAKLLWISNPVNPTGQHIPLEIITELVSTAKASGTVVVVDEAYGEYADHSGEVVSASHLVGGNPHLMVLRTFSKIYCLPSARVGYMACSSDVLRNAVDMYRPMFPFSWISLYMAQLAVLDDEHLDGVRTRLAQRKKRLYAQVRAADSGLESFTFMDSDTNTIMFRHASLGATELHEALARKGFLTANLDRLAGIRGERFLRLTVHHEEANDLFLQACREVAAENEARG